MNYTTFNHIITAKKAKEAFMENFFVSKRVFVRSNYPVIERNGIKSRVIDFIDEKGKLTSGTFIIPSNMSVIDCPIVKIRPSDSFRVAYRDMKNPYANSRYEARYGNMSYYQTPIVMWETFMRLSEYAGVDHNDLILDRSWEYLKFDNKHKTRCHMVMRNLGLKTIREVWATDDKVFLSTPNFGRTSLKILRLAIIAYREVAGC